MPERSVPSVRATVRLVLIGEAIFPAELSSLFREGAVLSWPERPCPEVGALVELRLQGRAGFLLLAGEVVARDGNESFSVRFLDASPSAR